MAELRNYTPSLQERIAHAITGGNVARATPQNDPVEWRAQFLPAGITQSGRRTFAVPQAAMDAYNAFQLPGDVWAGRVNPSDPEQIDRAFGLAGQVTLGSGIFPANASLRSGATIRRSKIHSKAEEIAKQLEEKGYYTPDENRRISHSVNRFGEHSSYIPTRFGDLRISDHSANLHNRFNTFDQYVAHGDGEFDVPAIMKRFDDYQPIYEQRQASARAREAERAREIELDRAAKADVWAKEQASIAAKQEFFSRPEFEGMTETKKKKAWAEYKKMNRGM